MPNDLPKPEVIITHESDLDGLLSGMLLQKLALKLFSTEIPLHAYHNHNWRQRGLPERSAWVADLAFENRLDKADWVIIDHHITETAPRAARLIHDSSKSASLLCYELCNAHGISSPVLDELVNLSNLADLFLETDPEFQRASDYASLVKTYQFWNLHKVIGGQPERLLNHPLLEVMEVKRRLENPLGLEWSRRHIEEISPVVAIVTIVIGNTNAIVNAILEEGVTPHPVLVTLFRKSNGMVLASFRSRHGEALAIAERFQGGGHPNACGASLPRSVQGIQEAIAYLRRILNPTPSPETRTNSGLNDLENAFSKIL